MKRDLLERSTSKERIIKVDCHEKTVSLRLQNSGSSKKRIELVTLRSKRVRSRHRLLYKQVKWCAMIPHVVSGVFTCVVYCPHSECAVL